MMKIQRDDQLFRQPNSVADSSWATDITSAVTTMTHLVDTGKRATAELEQFYKKDPYITDSRVWPVLERVRLLERLFSQFDKHVHAKWFKLDNLFNLQKTVNAVRDCEEAITALVEVSQGCKDMEAPRWFRYSTPPAD